MSKSITMRSFVIPTLLILLLGFLSCELIDIEDDDEGNDSQGPVIEGTGETGDGELTFEASSSQLTQLWVYDWGQHGDGYRLDVYLLPDGFAFEWDDDDDFWELTGSDGRYVLLRMLFSESTITAGTFEIVHLNIPVDSLLPNSRISVVENDERSDTFMNEGSVTIAVDGETYTISAGAEDITYAGDVEANFTFEGPLANRVVHPD